MSIEGTFIYGCPMPDHNDLPGIQGGRIPATGVITISTGQNEVNVQSLIDTLAIQREEIELLKQRVDAYKQCVALMKKVMTEDQLLALSIMVEVLTGKK
jgi:hypothetical protein